MDNFRQVGKEYTGRLYKGPMVDAFNRLTQSSIPTKSEQILSAVERKGGFGSSTDRFSQVFETESAPGPGQYKSSSAGESPSLSKKGYGGLISRSPRFKRYQYNTLAPGPGSYSQKEAQVTAVSSVFQRPIAKIVARHEFPAPGAYDVSANVSHLAVSSPFKSTTKRYKDYSSVSPPPWQYNIDGSFSIDSKPSPAFKMPVKARRYPINLYDPHAAVPIEISPGPADYQHPILPKINQKISSSFVRGDIDRFGMQTKVKKIHDFTPGPGAYYNLMAKDKSPVTGAVFMSESEREILKPPIKQPGPAFYKPIPVPKKKSYHLNANNVWI